MNRRASAIYQEISRSPPAAAFDCGWAHVRLLPGAPYAICDAQPAYRFGLALERQQGVHAFAGDRRCDFDAWPGEFAYTAPNVDVFSESPQGGEYLTLHAMSAVAGAIPAIETASPRVVFHGDRRAMRLGWHLRRLLLAPQREPQAIEQCAALLLEHGVSRLAAAKRSRDRAEIDRAAYTKVLEHIEACLDGPLPLAELAHLAGLPPLRFLRGFAAVFGVTPHAYITERRVQRARRRLQSGDESIATIAADCGFAHQSHLGAVFKNRLGSSPRQYRELSIPAERASGDTPFE